MDKQDSYDEQLERYLDGLLSDEEAAEFLSTIDADELDRIEALQSQLDDSLKRLGAISPLDPDVLAKQYLEAREPTKNLNSSPSEKTVANVEAGRRQWAKLVLAASILIATGGGIWYALADREVTPFFQPNSLAKVYVDTVDRGFRPYYNCEDPKRFADTFESRQGQPLTLSELPAESRMSGISYLGGLSRKTTAVLFEVDKQPVIVFVDVAGNRNLDLCVENDSPDLNVFVVKTNGLVFCEVTPHESASMIEHFDFHR